MREFTSRSGGLPLLLRRLAPLSMLLVSLVAGTTAWGAVDWSQCRTESGTTNISDGNSVRTETLSAGLSDTSRAFLLLDLSGPGAVDQGQDHMVSGYISSSNQVTFQRGGNSGQVELAYVVVECLVDAFSVQRGEIQISGGSSQATASITSVATARSLVLVSSRTDDGSNSQDTGLVTGELTGATTVQARRAGNANVGVWVRYEVVTFSTASEATVQTGEVTLPSGSASVTDGIPTAVTLNRAWLYQSWDASDDGLQQTAVGGQITATNEVTFYRHSANNYVNRVRWYVVEFPAATVGVQRGSEPLDSSNCGNDTACDDDIAIAPVSALNRAFSFVTNTTAGTGTAFPRNRWSDYLANSTTLRTTNWRTDGSNSNNYKFWQVVEFPQANNSTGAGTVSAAPGACDAIDVTAPYTGDSNANNTLSYRYRTPSGTGAWSSPVGLAHSGSPYSFSISGLSFGADYDVEVTFNDADGVTGVNPQTVTNVIAGANCTGAGTVIATQGPGATPTILVTAPYTFDANADNSLSYRYQVSGSGSWSAPANLPHDTTPYAFTISDLTCGSSYDVEVTYVDPDGVGSGSATQTVANILIDYCTVAGSAGAVVDGCDQITVSAPFTLDANGDGSTSFERGPGAGGPWSAVSGCSAVGGASPRTCVDTGLSEATDYHYRVTYSDPDGVGGTAQQLLGPLNTGACNAPPVTPGTPAALADSCSQITVSAPFTGDTNGNSTTTVEYNTTNSWPGTTACAGLTGASPRTCPIAGLANAAAYYFRVTFADPDGVVGSNPQIVGPVSTQDCRVAPAVPTANATACDSITVSAPFSGDANGDSQTSFEQGTTGGGPWSAVCSGVSGPSPRSCIDSPLSGATDYYYRVQFSDPDGIVGVNPQIIGPITTPACAANDTTTGTASAQVGGCSQITVTLPFTGDANENGSVLVEYNTSNSWPGTTACGATGGPAPRTCLITNLSAATTYYVRATYSDPDGVSGQPVQVLPGTYTTSVCAGNGAPPMVLFLSPSRNAVVGATDRFKIQVYDPDGVLAANVLWGLDGAAPTDAVTEVTNFDCNLGSQTACKLFEFDVDTTLLVNGSHYVTVQATDSASTPSVARLSWGFQVNNAGASAAGSGKLLRRTHGSQVCSDCHNLATHSSQAISVDYGSWAQDCLTCHTPHDTTNIFLVRGAIETPNSGKRSVDFRNTDGKADNSFASVSQPGTGVCEVCHTKTQNSDATPRFRNTGESDGGKHYTSSCDGCHTHSLGFGAGESEGGATCAGCHPDIWDGMNGNVARASRHLIGAVEGVNDAFTDSGITWGSPLSSNAAATRSCLNMCHNDHPHTITGVPTHENALYRDSTSSVSRDAGGTSTAANRADTDFDAAATNGGTCVSCHRNPIVNGWPTVSKADYNASAHNYTSDVGGAWTYTLHDGGVFNRNCTKCHSDGDAAGNASAIPFGAVHYSDNPRLLSNALNPGGTASSNVCYTCHGNGAIGTDRSGKDLASVTAKTYNHPVDDDTVHDGAAEFAVSYNDGTFAGANRHVNCDDCHDPHAAGTTLHTPGTTGNVVGPNSPLYSATGVAFTPPGTNFAVTSSGNFTWTTSVTREYEVCFKCHSNFAFDGNPPSGQTDVAQEFSTSNASYHPVVGALPANDPGANGSSRLTSTQMTNGWTPGDTMYCSDCHGPETASPAVQGPHGSAIQYILWPSRNAAYSVWPGAWPSGQRMRDNWQDSFCRNCHPLNEDGNWSNNRAHDKHEGRTAVRGCYMCHIIVPHGGKMSRFIGDRDGNMPARYAYQGNLNNMEITSFTKSSDPSNYSKQDCQAACENPGDHESPANENWN